jgi:hypothetical protein
MNVISLNDSCGLPLACLADLNVAVENYTATVFKCKGNDIGTKQESYIQTHCPQIKISNKIRSPTDLLIANIPKCTSQSYDPGLLPYAIEYTRNILKAIKLSKPKYYIVICHIRAGHRQKNEIRNGLPKGFIETQIDGSHWTPIRDTRIYFTNFKLDRKPRKNRKKLQSYIDSGKVDRAIGLSCTTAYHKGATLDRYYKYGHRQIVFEQDEFTNEEIQDRINKGSNTLNFKSKQRIRKLTPDELIKLYQLPDNFFEGETTLTAYRLMSVINHVGVLQYVIQSIPKLHKYQIVK